MALELKLNSPVGSDADVYQWPIGLLTGDRVAGQIDVGMEVVETIRWVYQEFPGVIVESDLLSNYDTNSFESMNNLVDKYNNSIDAYLLRLKDSTHRNERLVKRQSSSSRNLLRHILQQVYKHAVTDPEKLGQYKKFSPEVYGETSFELVCQIIDSINITEEDIFIDLGSGVGQIVLQVAASTPCKMVWGIERADWPSRYAEQMDFHFKRLMRWWGKPYREYQLIKGDFLDQRHSKKLSSASIVFVNNFIFGAEVDQQLKDRFTELQDGARIVSSKEFCPLNFNINQRNLNDVSSIMDVIQLSTFPGSVSWTDKPVDYFLHTINRAKLELYFNPLKGKENTPNSRTSRTTTNANQVLQSDSSSNMLVRQSSDLGGARTRRARQEAAKKSGKPDAIATVACNSAGKPVGRVGRRRRNQAINKKSIPEVASPQNPSNSERRRLSCNISDGTVSLPQMPDQQVAMVDETNIPSVEMFLDEFRKDLVAVISSFKDPKYRQDLTAEIKRQRQRNAELTSEVAKLNQEIVSLMITEKTHTLHRQQQREEMCRDRELSRAGPQVYGEIAVVYQESVLKQIRSSMISFKRLNCPIYKLSAANITSNRTKTVFRPSDPQCRANYSSAPFQPPNDCTPCVNQVLLGFDLEDNLKNLALSILNYNAHLAAKQMKQFFDYSSKNKTKVHSNTRELCE